MATGRVQTRFLYARTQPAGLPPKPEPARLINRFFFWGPKLAPSSPVGPTQPMPLQGPIRGPIKKKKKKKDLPEGQNFHKPRSETQKINPKRPRSCSSI